MIHSRGEWKNKNIFHLGVGKDGRPMYDLEPAEPIESDITLLNPPATAGRDSIKTFFTISGRE